ncbi:MAG: diguanylate cyclase [Phycisphaerae bacterium]|nr:diguanylate cyclase [Phycisphaerae bacterium]
MWKPRVLIAEDNPDHQRLLELSLTGTGQEVELSVVSSGEDLLRLIAKRSFDCLVLDFNLPDHRADQLLPLIAERGCECPVIVVSSSLGQQVVVQSMRSGSTDFVPKSEAIQGDTLWRRIQVALDHKRRRAHRQRQIERRVKRLARLAESDLLTGLSNRLYLHRVLNGRRHHFDRRGTVCGVMLDLDRFKAVNDTYGHLCGDMVLREIGGVLRASARPDDILCRWGGEEFLVVMPRTSLGTCWLWADQLRRTIRQLRLTWSGTPVPMTVSVGVAEAPASFSREELVGRADQALYMAKSRGRDRVCSWAMVVLERLLDDDEVLTAGDLQQQIQTMVAKAGDALGPTQRDHLLAHSTRVATLARQIGVEMGFSTKGSDALRLAGLSHDLGKFIIPEDILAKPSALSGEEWALCEQHSMIGADICGCLGMGDGTTEHIRHHHCRYDGNGRYRGLRKDEVTLGSRILAAADAYDAMTSWRSYQRARSPQDAIRELLRERGGQFHPDVVDAAVRLLSPGETASASLTPLVQSPSS